jgi:hypothetical protein
MNKIIIFIFVVFIFSNFFCTEEGKVGVALLDGSELSEGDRVPFLLYQNYPNPFNPTTSIRFDVAGNIKLKLNVYTSDWIEVKTLVNKSMGPGTHQVVFIGNSFPSGDYFYTLEGGGHSQIRKMKIVK